MVEKNSSGDLADDCAPARIITALALMFYGGHIAQVIADHYGFRPDLYHRVDGVAMAGRARLWIIEKCEC